MAQRKEVGAAVDAGAEVAGYDCGCWSTILIQDWIFNRFNVEYEPRYVAELLDHLGDVVAEQFETFADLTKKVDEKLNCFGNLPKSILGWIEKYLPARGEQTA